MTTTLFTELYNSWYNRELQKIKNKKRRYLHFDQIINIPANRNWIKSYFSNAAENVPKHSFYPFIKSDIRTPRTKYEKDPLSNKTKVILTEKIRPISYSAHFDSIIYSWYSTILTYEYESKLPIWGIKDCVIAYLEIGKNNIHFAKDVFDFINSTGECVVLTYDLSSFFDTIDHDILKKQWNTVLGTHKLPNDHYHLYKALTNYTFIEKETIEIFFPYPFNKGLRYDRICEPEEFRQWVKSERVIKKNPFKNNLQNSKRNGLACGIPQGSPISACLSNIYMIDFDQRINTEVVCKKGLYRRYSDDLIIVCSPNDVNHFNNLVTAELLNQELTLNEKKTDIIYFRKNIATGNLEGYSDTGNPKKLQYLGFEFDGVHSFIRSSSMARYYQKMRSAIRRTIEDAYDAELGQRNLIFRKKIRKRFTTSGKRNFLSYSTNAKEIMQSPKIKRQILKSTKKVNKLILRYKNEKENQLQKEGKKFNSMR